ncbi:hypothetical protein HZB05_00635 [Candidatus Wolfebacteria bacterium]|nr:hypothetical protein [Candidatus Wolfebacteria bacterium]
MAEKKETEKHNPLVSLVVFVVIWFTFFLVVFSNANVRKFISNLFAFSKKGFYQDVIFVSDEKNEFSGAKFYYEKKPDVNDVAQSLLNPRTFFAATNYGIFVSYDEGLDWYHIDLPKEIGAAIPVSRIFTNPNDYSEIYFLILDGDNGVIYSTRDNFYSVKKKFEIKGDVIDKIIGNRSISTIFPAGDKFIIGTK